MREVERKRLVELLDKNCGYVEEQKAEELADHLLANGAIVPPCKVDDTLYLIDGDYFWEAKVIRVAMRWGLDDYSCIVAVRYTDGEIGIIANEESFGKTVFFSEAEAKYALKNRRSVSLVNGHIEE